MQSNNTPTEFRTPNPLVITTLDVSPNGKMLVVGQQADAQSKLALSLWSLGDRQLVTPLIQNPDAISLAARFSPDGAILAYSDENQDLVLYDLLTGTADRSRFPVKFTKWLSFGWNANRLIVGGVRTQVWDAKDNAIIWTLPMPPLPDTAAIDPACCALSADGGRVAASGVERGRIVIYAVGTEEVVGVIEGTMDKARSMAFDPSGQFLAAVAENGGAGFWEIETGTAILPQLLHVSADYYWCVRFHPDGKHVGFGLWSGFVEVINFRDVNGAVNQDVPVHRGRVWDLAFTRDGKRMVSGGDDGVVLVWDFAEL